MSYTFWGTGVKSETIPNPQIAEELHKPITIKFEKLTF